MGFKKSKDLVTFYTNTPNNTYSSYWFRTNGYWNPLFPRHEEIDVDIYGKKQLINYNLNKILGEEVLAEIYTKMSSHNFITILIYHMYNRRLEECDLKQILGYTNYQVKAHKKDMVKKGWLTHNYKLTDKASAFINSQDFSKLTKDNLFSPAELSNKNFESKDSLAVKDVYENLLDSSEWDI